MSENPFNPQEIQHLYAAFDAPITALDCGQKCAPYNAGGKPFCCDVCHAVPTAYLAEWDYSQNNTKLWFPWEAKSCTNSEAERLEELKRLQEETPDSMILLECLGPDRCERDFRTFTCRQFPFFPYITSDYKFIGLSYYWEYEDDCWVVSHLDQVTDEYLTQFVQVYEQIFARMPAELENYHYHSETMRDVFNEQRRAIPLLHRNGFGYKISTHNERMRRIPIEKMPKFGPYKVAAEMPFPDGS